MYGRRKNGCSQFKMLLVTSAKHTALKMLMVST